MSNCVGVQVLGRKFIVNEEGEVWRILVNGELKLIPNVPSGSTGYNSIQGDKKISRHRLMGYTYLGLDIENPKTQIDHIDGNRLNNSLSNLRIVNHQQNMWNRMKSKGYYKNGKKWVAMICFNKKLFYIGTYETEAEAHTNYLKAKLIYHKII